MYEETGITQNQSESINFVMHSLLKWKEVPIDVLLLAIYRLQLYFLKEIQRGRAGIGSYALRAEQRPYAITAQEIPDLTVCPPENIIESMKNKTFSTEPTDGKNRHSFIKGRRNHQEWKTGVVEIYFSRL